MDAQKVAAGTAGQLDDGPASIEVDLTGDQMFLTHAAECVLLSALSGSVLCVSFSRF